MDFTTTQTFQKADHIYQRELASGAWAYAKKANFEQHIVQQYKNELMLTDELAYQTYKRVKHIVILDKVPR